MLIRPDLQGKAETKAERLEQVITHLMDNLPLPARILAQNSITTFLQYSEEGAEKIVSVLKELQDYISEGIVPNDEPINEGTDDINE